MHWGLSIFFSIILLLFNYSCLHFLPTPAKPTFLPCCHPPPWFCPCVLYSSSCNPLSSLSPPHSSLAIVTMFLISMSLVIFCLLFSFVDYVPVKGEIMWYLSLTARLISLSIMLSSSIHAVAKGQAYFKQLKLYSGFPLYKKVKNWWLYLLSLTGNFITDCLVTHRKLFLNGCL